jgi:hypothetical protein
MKPPFAPTIYTNGRDIILEFPCKPGRIPVVMKFPFTEGGLGKALKSIPSIIDHADYVIGGSNIADKLLPKIIIARATKRKRESTLMPQEVKNSAASIIRGLKE